MKNQIPLVIFVVGSAGAVLLFFVLSRCFGLGSGDIGAIFTGVGLAGVVATLWYQGEQGGQERNKHRELLEAMDRQSRLNSLTAELGALQSMIVDSDPDTSRTQNVQRRNELFAEIGKYR